MRAKIKALIWARGHLIAAMCLAFALGVAAAMLWGVTKHYQMKEIEQASRFLQQENKVLLQEKAAWVVEQSITKGSHEGLRKSLQEQESQIAEQERALDFYRTLMDPGANKKGLVLNSYAIYPGENAQQLDLHLIFVQYAKRRTTMRAKANITIKGSFQGKQKLLNLADLLGDGAENNALSFRYFQRLRYQLTLPEGFEPQSLLVQADIKSRNSKPWQLELPWFIEEN